MPGLVISVGGRLDPSFNAALAKATAMGESANARLAKAINKSNASPEEKKAALAKLALDDEINRHIVNNDLARQAIRKRRMAKEAAEIAAGSGGFGWVGKTGGAAMEGVAEGAASAGKHVGGLNLVLRETVVVLREIGRGNWARVPGSVSLIVQGLAQMKQLSLATLGVWGAAAAVVFGAVYERIWGIKNLMKELSFDVSKIDAGRDYVPKLKRHLADARNEQKALNDEIRKTMENYYSAEQAAKRQADATKEHYDHLRKMNDLSNAPENVKSQRGLEIDADERRQEIENKAAEATALQAEAQKKLAAANSGKLGQVATKEEDQATQGQLDEKAKAAAEFLKGGDLWTEFKKSAANVLGGVSKETIAQVEAGGTDLVNKFIKDANDFKDKTEANDELRKQKAELVSDATKSAGKAAEINASLPDLQKQAAQKNTDEAIEAKAKLLYQSAGAAQVTERERIGAGAASSVNVSILQTAKQSLAVQQALLTSNLELAKQIYESGGF